MKKLHFKPNVVVIGGGTGSAVVLSGLKQLSLDLSAIITVADSGGSTGRLRDEFGFLPVGDLRQALAALASNSSQEPWIQKMLLYRFSKGSGLEGHNLGNLILTALQDMSGSTSAAVEIAAKTFRLHGHIYPITSKNIQLVTEYEDGTVIIGEDVLDESTYGGQKIVSLKTSPRATIYSGARDAILAADLIVIGPGDLYGSIIPNLVVEGAAKAIQTSNAKIVYIVNLMTRYAQTHGLTGLDHVRLIEKYLHKTVDHIIVNTQPIPSAVIKKYAKQHEYPVVNDLSTDPRYLGSNLLTTKIPRKNPADRVNRSYIRHSATKIATTLERLLP